MHKRLQRAQRAKGEDNPHPAVSHTHLSGFLDSGHTRNCSREASKACGTPSFVSEKGLRAGGAAGALSTNGGLTAYRGTRAFTVDAMPQTFRIMTDRALILYPEVGLLLRRFLFPVSSSSSLVQRRQQTATAQYRHRVVSGDKCNG